MKHQNTESQHNFAAGYTSRKRLLEYTSIIGFMVLFGVGATRVYDYASVLSFWGLIGSALVAFLFADFASGFVHWLADTWGSVHWPIVGQTLIRSFREHHVDAKAITRHDFVETNGDNCLICIPILAVLAWSQPQQFLSASLHFIFLNVVFWTFLTNQFHKWAHADTLPKWVQMLQKSKFILSTEHHSQHHSYPFCSHYCITSGWMNGPLKAIGFFRVLERAITGLTGAQPRGEDLANIP